MAHTSSEDVMLSTEQQTVFDWLNNKLLLPMFAEAYKGALYLLDQKPPGYITFVSHAGRDLMNRLVRVERDLESKQVQYVNRLDELQEVWENEWGAEDINTVDSAEDGHLISSELYEKIRALIDDHKAGRLRVSEADSLFFSTFLGYDDSVRIGKNFFEEWKMAREWFFKQTHLRKGEFEVDASSEVERHFQMLDNLLYEAATSEFGRMRIIDESLEEANE